MSLEPIGSISCPNVSYKETLKSCEEHKSYGTQPGHAKFYYPKKYGYGEVFVRIARSMDENLVYGVSVNSMDFSSKIVTCSNGESYQADTIISTIHWTSLEVKNGSSEVISSI